MTETQQWLFAEWQGALRQSLESMTGQTVTVEQAEEGAPDPNTKWWKQPLSLGAEAEIWAGTTSNSAQEIGRHVLQGAGIEESEPAEMESTYQEVLSQALGTVGQTVGAKLRREVICIDGARSSVGPSLAFTLRLTFPGSEPLLHWVAFSAALVTALSPKAEVQVSASAPEVSRSVEGVPRAVEKSKTLDLLLEVELPVSVSFGRAQLRLKDVVKLTSGSIVELNRAVTEPVEVIVNNCVIARGEVVVIDGYYGVRIHQIISRQDRLRTLT